MPTNRVMPSFIDEATEISEETIQQVADLYRSATDSTPPRFINPETYWQQRAPEMPTMDVPAEDNPEEEQVFTNSDITYWEIDVNNGYAEDTAHIILNSGEEFNGIIHELSFNPLLGTTNSTANIAFRTETDWVRIQIEVTQDTEGNYIWKSIPKVVENWSEEL